MSRTFSIFALAALFIGSFYLIPGVSQSQGGLGSVTKSVALQVDADGNGRPSPGDTLQYTIAIPNQGAGPLTGIVFTDTAATSLSLVTGSVTTSRGTVDTGNNAGDSRVVVSVPRIEAHENVIIQLSMRVCLCVAEGTEVVNQGYVESPSGPVPTDNPSTPAPEDETSIVIEPQDTPVMGKVTKSVSLQVDADGSGSPTAGDTLRYTIRIPNGGQIPLTGVVFTDPVDHGLKLVYGSVTATKGTVVSGNGVGDTHVSVSIPVIAVGQTVTVTLDARVLPGVQEVSNQAIVDTSTGRIPTDNPDTSIPNDETVTPVGPSPLVVPPPDHPPVAEFEYVIVSGRLVQFRERCRDEDNDLVSWSWAFGDGAKSTERNPTHDYRFSPLYVFMVELTCTDSARHKDTAIRRVILSEPYIMDPPIADVLDENRNGRIDTEEFMMAIDYWISHEPVPHTEDQPQRVIDDPLFFQLLDMWLNQAPIRSVAEQAAGGALKILRPAGGAPMVYLALSSEIHSAQIEVFRLNGERLAQGQSAGRTLRLTLEGDAGRWLANGVYLYVLTMRDLYGEVRQQVQTFAIVR